MCARTAVDVLRLLFICHYGRLEDYMMYDQLLWQTADRDVTVE